MISLYEHCNSVNSLPIGQWISSITGRRVSVPKLKEKSHYYSIKVLIYIQNVLRIT